LNSAWEGEVAMPDQATVNDSLIGLKFGHYRILERIGSGGMGVVYRAHDDHLDREVAIKVLPLGTLADDASRRRFRNEALTLSKLNHPNIATIFDFDTQQGLDFLVMECIPGVTLSEKLKESSLPEKEVLALGAQFAEGLSAAHEHAVVHRDLKPGNLRLSLDGRLKILDFGLAKLRASATTSVAMETVSETGALAGTLPYMAPEQVLGGEIDTRTDIHAAGAVLYEMATGQGPFATVERSQLISAILHSSPRSASSINLKLSPELARIIAKCLEKEPENRYQSAKELAIDLRRLQSPATAGGLASDVGSKQWNWWKLGVAAMVAVALVAMAIGFVAGRIGERFGGAQREPIQSIAVLPLANLSHDPEQEYFADGMTEELITELSQIGSLKVISRTSVMRFKGSGKALPQIARELNVDGIVEGSVLRSGDQVRITAQLIHAPSDTHIWAKSYERDLHEVLTLQSEVAQAIAKEIKAKVTPEERTRLTRAHQVDPQSYELYLKGRYFWNKRTPEALKKGLEYFQSAADKDPTNGLAFAGLADTYAILGSAGEYGVMSPKEAMPKAEAAAKEALQLDSTLAEAHVTLGYLGFIFDWDWQDAEREFQQAIKLNPSYAHAHHWYAYFLAYTGRPTDAISEIRKAETLDPLSLIISTDVGEILDFLRQYDHAIEQLKKAIEMDPNFAAAHFTLAHSYTHEKRYPEAISEMKRAIELAGDDPTWNEYLAYVYALADHRKEAIEILNVLNEQSKHRFIPASNMVYAYMALGDTNRAFYFLEKAYAERETIVSSLGRDPDLDPLRSDPRFQELLRRMNFPP
jgi:eukaryotic-like serine/threonine-protein kinase